MKPTLVGIALALLLAACAQEPPPLPERVQKFAALPDWSGLWELDGNEAEGTADAPRGYADKARLKLAQKPPYNAQWEAKVAADIAASGPPPQTKTCLFWFPQIMEGPAMFQLAITPEETLIVFSGDHVRHVYTDGRNHPPAEDLWPTPFGDSVGRWEGSTLVIDTIARKAGRINLTTPYPVSDAAHFIERISMIDRDHLQNELTIEDPVAFASPWKVTLRYKRVTDLDRMLFSDCYENDRNPIVDGKVIISPP